MKNIEIKIVIKKYFFKVWFFMTFVTTFLFKNVIENDVKKFSLPKLGFLNKQKSFHLLKIHFLANKIC